MHKTNFSNSSAIHQLVNGFFNSSIGDILEGDLVTTSPKVNISETNDDFNIMVAAPGLKKSDFKISLEDNSLTISAKVEKDSSVEGIKHKRREFNYSTFSRTFAVPTGVNRKSIIANYEDGILTIRLPKHDEVKTKDRTIEIS